MVSLIRAPSLGTSNVNTAGFMPQKGQSVSPVSEDFPGGASGK